MSRKRSITLLEVMIVIFLIGLIGGVVGYNMRGSLEAGKAFKSEQGITRLEEILELEAVTQGITLDEIADNPRPYLENTGLFRDVDAALLDGWGEAYVMKVDKKKIVVSSKALTDYNANRKRNVTNSLKNTAPAAPAQSSATP
jgi:type II secretory pathway pseudopilin PulG